MGKISIKMNDGEISAFAAYAKKKNKIKKTNFSVGLESKSKNILKNKKLNTSKNKVFLNILNKNKEVKNLNGTIGKIKNKPVLEKAIKPNVKILKAPNKSILNGNNSPSINVEEYAKENINAFNQTSEKKQIDATDNLVCEAATKKTKKKKILNDNEYGELLNNNLCKNKKAELLDSNEKSNNLTLNKKINSASIICEDSVQMGENLLTWLLSPVELRDFFNTSWEIKPLHIKRNNSNFYKNICTLKDFKIALKENDIYFTKNIDVTSYVNGVRTTENPEGKATLPIVWDCLKKGKSIRLLNPQTFIPNIRLLNTTLQEFFHCFVGANIYLTPADSQGFAPHYDDIEAFVLQLEGKKHWKLYNPRCPQEVLPRESSPNFREEEIGEPILEVTLQPGDLLYFPRGIIHQAKCLPDVHSLHITVSCYQKNSWADLFEKILPVALQQAISEDVEFRKGLPIGYLSHMGMLFSDVESHFRQEMFRKFEELAQKIFQFCPLDAAADQMGVDFMQDALPPCLTNEEKLHGGDRNIKCQKKNIFNFLKNQSESNLSIKLIRATSTRLVSEDNEVYLYYTTDNSLAYHDAEVSRVLMPEEWIPAFESLVRAYPNFLDLKSLPMTKKGDNSKKWKRIAEFVHFLWQRGLVMFDKQYSSLRT